MSKVLFINGSPREDGCDAVAIEETVNELKKDGVESKVVWLGKTPMPDCMACGKCQEIGKCVYDDAVNLVAAQLDDFDALVVATPVYYGGPNGRLQSFLDRLMYSAPNAKFAGKFAATITSCRRGGASECFARMNQYFLMMNMTVVGSQYWNQIHGSNAEQARQDKEGLQTMRTLAQNLAWLLRCKEAGEKAGVKKPVYEDKVFTNFIR